MREFHSTNDMLEGFMLSVYVLGVSCSPDNRKNRALTPA
jgi:hypothetical protein